MRGFSAPRLYLKGTNLYLVGTYHYLTGTGHILVGTNLYLDFLGKVFGLGS